MEFRIEGLEEVKKKLEELEEGLTLHGLQHWAKEIEAKARDLAVRSSEEVRNSILIEVFETKPKSFQVRARPKQEALSFIAEATRDKLKDMPVTSRPIFKAFLDQVEKKLTVS